MQAALYFDGKRIGINGKALGHHFLGPVALAQRGQNAGADLRRIGTVGVQTESLLGSFKAKQGVFPGFSLAPQGMQDTAEIDRRAKIAGLQFGGAAIEDCRLPGVAMGQTMPGKIEMCFIALGIKRYGLLESVHGFGGPAIERGCHAIGSLGFSQIGIKRQGLACDDENFFDRNIVGMPGPELRMAQGNSGKCLGISWPAFALGRALKQAARQPERRGGPHMKEVASLEITVVGIKFHRLRLFGRGFSRQQFYAELLDNGAGNFILQGEDVGEFPVIAIGPEMGAGNTISELGGNPHALPGCADAAFENGAGT